MTITTQGTAVAGRFNDVSCVAWYATAVINKMLDRAIDDNTLAKVENPYNDITSKHRAYSIIIEASIDHEYTRDGSGSEQRHSWE